MNKKKLALLIVIFILLTGCQLTGPSASDLAATMVIQTAQAVPPTATPTIAPTETAVPSPTITPTSAPTFTSTPSGPLVIKDNFASKSDIWGACDECVWRDEKLYLGPFPPRGEGINQVFAIVCEACEGHSYFRVAADLTFSDGVAGDRTFGVGVSIPNEFYAGTGIATSQIGVLEAFDFQRNWWTGSKYQLYGAINPGVATNRVEFAVKPTAAGGTDFYAIINGKTVVVLSNITNRPTDTLRPAIYLGWHSVGITVDNFEYEEIVP